MTRRRWIADSWDETTAALTGAQALHLARVLRAQIGMEFDIVTGDRVRRGTIVEMTDETVELSLSDEIERDAALPLTLVLAVFKFDRLEWAIEKATELGVQRIIPVIARRTEKHLAQAAPARVERWRRVAREAAQQSRRSDMIDIADPAALKSVAHEEPLTLRLLLSETERLTTLRDALPVRDALPIDQADADEDGRSGIRLAVGPEGGWTDDELALFATAGWKPVSLGPRILRAETAAIAAAAICSALIG